MSMQDAFISTNGTGAGSSQAKRSIANKSVAGSVVTVQFSKDYDDHLITLDTSTLSPMMQAMLAAQGAGAVIQAAYTGLNVTDPRQAAQEMVERLKAGTWHPGPARGEALPNPLIQATAEYLSKQSGNPYPFERVEEKFLPAYQRQHGLADVGAARRKLRQHPEISARIAQIEAERAKLAAQRAKGGHRENLLDIEA